MKKKIYILIGPPSVGKSTWIKDYFKDESTYIINNDDVREEFAEKIGWTYEDTFVEPSKKSIVGYVHPKYGEVIKTKKGKLKYSNVQDLLSKVSGKFKRLMREADGHENIVVDITNLTPGVRKKSLKIVGTDYKKIAVVFNFKGSEKVVIMISEKRSNELAKVGKSKNISRYVFDMMFKSYQPVTKDEGFDEIINVDNIPSMYESLSDEEKNEINK
ncbi:ATP-binding protein [bacterium]|jgi:predicted kinase|nr:ATP-binding protein [bacterium]